jgi:hypothetical protein
MRRPVVPSYPAALLATALLAGLLLAAPVAGHAINFAGLDPQVATEGTVYVEAVFVEAPGWVALYADGSPVGHSRVETAGRTVNDVAVDVDDAAFEGGESVRLTARLFADDGDGAFDPDADRRLRQFGAAPDAPVAQGDAAYVLAEADGTGLPVEDGTLPVRRVALPEAGHVVVSDENGTVLGSRAVDAGIHQNVSVPLADDAVAEDEAITVVVTAYGDDGDGEFDDADEPLRVGNETVSTTVDAHRGGSDGGGVTTAIADGATPTDGSGPGFALSAALFAALAVVGYAAVGALREAEGL